MFLCSSIYPITLAKIILRSTSYQHLVYGSTAMPEDNQITKFRWTWTEEADEKMEFVPYDDPIVKVSLALHDMSNLKNHCHYPHNGSSLLFWGFKIHQNALRDIVLLLNQRHEND